MDKIGGVEEARLIEVLMALDVADSDKLSLAIKDIVKVRLANELKVGQGIGVGLLAEVMTVQDASALMNKSKDSLSDLIKIIQLLEGRSTSNVDVTLVQMDAMADVVRRELGGVN